MRRGEVWWANLPPPMGRRPVVLLSRNAAYAVRGMVTAAPVTTRARHILAEVPIGPEDGLPRACVVNLDNINTFDKELLDQRITALSQDKLQAMEAAVHFALGVET